MLSDLTSSIKLLCNRFSTPGSLGALTLRFCYWSPHAFCFTCRTVHSKASYTNYIFVSFAPLYFSIAVRLKMHGINYKITLLTYILTTKFLFYLHRVGICMSIGVNLLVFGYLYCVWNIIFHYFIPNILPDLLLNAYCNRGFI